MNCLICGAEHTTCPGSTRATNMKGVDIVPNPEMKGGIVATERIYLDNEGKVAKNKEDRAFLLAAEGQTIPADKAAELGITAKGRAKAEPKTEATVAADEAVTVTGRAEGARPTGGEVTKASDTKKSK
jgi:hypothetical protein